MLTSWHRFAHTLLCSHLSMLTPFYAHILTSLFSHIAMLTPFYAHILTSLCSHIAMLTPFYARTFLCSHLDIALLTKLTSVCPHLFLLTPFHAHTLTLLCWLGSGTPSGRAEQESAWPIQRYWRSPGAEHSNGENSKVVSTISYPQYHIQHRSWYLILVTSTTMVKMG